MIGRRSTAVQHTIRGWRVLVPRPEGRADDLAALLRRTGATPLCVPLISTNPQLDSDEMRCAAADLAAGVFDWVAFTSTAAVAACLAVADRGGIGRPVGGETRVAVVGDATAAAARAAGIEVDLVPDGPGSAAALAAGWPPEPAGRSVLLPRSDRARPELPEALRARGYRVREVCAYRTVMLPVPDQVASDLATGDIDGVLLTSPSTADALSGVPVAARTTVVAIGRSTADAADAAGLTVTVTATRPTAAGLVDALLGGAVTATSPGS